MLAGSMIVSVANYHFRFIGAVASRLIESKDIAQDRMTAQQPIPPQERETA
jgi:hypothetical protein